MSFSLHHRRVTVLNNLLHTTHGTACSNLANMKHNDRTRANIAPGMSAAIKDDGGHGSHSTADRVWTVASSCLSACFTTLALSYACEMIIATM
jgi:hypothetical protein